MIRSDLPANQRSHQKSGPSTLARPFLVSSDGTGGISRTQFVLAIVWLLLVNSGCYRGFYRQQADKEAYGLIDQKVSPQCWPLGRRTINTHPLSRMFDPFDLDCPPMPPDDPTAHTYMRCVDGKRGYAGWDEFGRRDQVEGPSWRDSLPYADDGVVELTQEQAVELALLHSPVYQQSLETLYLSALDVSFERFQFDTQFFGGASTFFAADGRDRSGGGGESSSRLEFSTFSDLDGTSLRANRFFATGAELAVSLANSIIWEFSGPDVESAFTLLDFSLIQPLLRGGGRDVVLENLTFSERALLSNVRQMERFRRAFYVEIATGRFASDVPFRGGPRLEALNGLTDTTGRAGGYLGLLQQQQIIRNQRSNIAALQSSVAQLQAFFLAGRIDFFQVEFSRQALFNAQSFLLSSERNLAESLDQYKISLGLPPSIDVRLDDTLIQPFQLVDPEIIPLQNELTQLQQQTGELLSQLVGMVETPAPKPQEKAPQVQEEAPQVQEEAPQVQEEAPERVPETAPQNSIDESLPIPAEASGDPTFDFDPIGPVETEGESPREQTQTLGNIVAPPPFRLAWSPAAKERLEELRRQLQSAEKAVDKARKTHVPKARTDIARLRDSLESRREQADELRGRLEERLATGSTYERTRVDRKNKVTDADINALLPFDRKRLDNLPTILDETLVDVIKQLELSKKELALLTARMDQIIADGEQNSPEQLYEKLSGGIFTDIPDELNNLSATVLSLTLIEARARTESITLPTIDLKWQEAVEIARYNRLDWMNARTSLVDRWRNVQVTANDLESGLDLVLEGDIRNVGSSAVDLRPSAGRIRFGFQFDAPITRLIERNTYREAQIEYQQARRLYYQYEDAVTASLRDIIRRLNINEINFELRRAGIEVAIAQVELARLRLQQPPRPNEQAAPGAISLRDTTGFGATTARDLVSALSDLLNVQNDFLDVWISNEVLRRSLDLDLGTLQLDGAGQWVDPGEAIGASAREFLDRSAAEKWESPPGSSNQEIELLPAPSE